MNKTSKLTADLDGLEIKMHNTGHVLHCLKEIIIQNQHHNTELSEAITEH